MVQADSLSAWKALQDHHNNVGKSFVLKKEFEKDPSRFEKFSFTFDNTADGSEILFDFSKNFLTAQTLDLLVDVAKEAKIEDLRDAMFRGDKINFTEDRAVLHTALRNVTNEVVKVDGNDVMPGVNKELKHMEEFSEAIRSGEWKGYTGKPLTTIINIGIGGSDLCVPFSGSRIKADDRLGAQSWSPKRLSTTAIASRLSTSCPTLMARTWLKHSAIPIQRPPSS
jgi:glucose-6-phosphate isomerase